MRPRDGFTLIECLVVIALVGTTMGTVALTLHATRRADRHIRDEAFFAQQLGRLATQLRRDAHEARSATVEDLKEPKSPSAVLSLVLPEGRTARYTLRPPRIERVLEQGSNVLQRETYQLRESSAGRWQLHADRRLPLVSLVIEPGSTGPGPQPVAGTYRVDAVVDLFRIHSSPSKP
jgi:prepilin-type N-terminal cleavage/methylation domain-containing protein